MWRIGWLLDASVDLPGLNGVFGGVGGWDNGLFEFGIRRVASAAFPETIKMEKYYKTIIYYFKKIFKNVFSKCMNLSDLISNY